MTSFQFSQDHNFQTVLWDTVAAIASTVRGVGTLCRGAVPATIATVHRLQDSGTLAAIGRVLTLLGVALALGGVLVVAVVGVAMIPPTFWVGVAIIAVFGFVTKPRRAVAR